MIRSCIFLLAFLALNSCHSTSNENNLTGYKLEFWNNSPEANGWTNDWERLLTRNQTTNLNRIIDSFKSSTGLEIAIITLDTAYTTPDNFMDLASHIHEKWAITENFKDSGFLICISSGYHMIEILKGEKVKSLLSSDEESKIEETGFVPYFKKSENYEGILFGLHELMANLSPKIQNPNSRKNYPVHK
ncbi:MAG TPA: TPM domain-containing protein [Puia sp.]|nr:TPM domain-containing protein [Puia sp.]